MKLTMLQREELDWFLDLAPRLKWTFAKTMPDTPHEYVVRGKTLDEEDFVRAVRVIRTFGEPGKFYSMTNVYLVSPDGTRKWWTMGEPIEECQIINTATTDRVYGEQDAPSTFNEEFSRYDSLSTQYDAMYQSKEALEENEQIRKILVNYFGAQAPNTLDVGCGTGLLLDLGIAAPGLYVGVDPSQGMLNELIRKHPRVKKLHAKRFEDALDDLRGSKFDLITSLFGSPSYIPPEAIKELPDLLAPGGLMLLMHYRKGYAPKYETVADVPYHRESLQAALELVESSGGVAKVFNDFIVTAHYG